MKKKILSALLSLCIVASLCAATGITVFAENEAAQIGETKYATFDEALSKANDNETIKLLRDVKDEELEYAPSGNPRIYEFVKSVTLDLNNYTLETNVFRGVAAIKVNVGLNVTIKNGTIVTSKIDNGDESGAIFCRGANLTLIDVDIQSSQKYSISGLWRPEICTVEIIGNSNINKPLMKPEYNNSYIITGGTFVSNPTAYVNPEKSKVTQIKEEEWTVTPIYKVMAANENTENPDAPETSVQAKKSGKTATMRFIWGIDYNENVAPKKLGAFFFTFDNEEKCTSAKIENFDAKDLADKGFFFGDITGITDFNRTYYAYPIVDGKVYTEAEIGDYVDNADVDKKEAE